MPLSSASSPTSSIPLPRRLLVAAGSTAAVIAAAALFYSQKGKKSKTKKANCESPNASTNTATSERKLSLKSMKKRRQEQEEKDQVNTVALPSDQNQITTTTPQKSEADERIESSSTLTTVDIVREDQVASSAAAVLSTELVTEAHCQAKEENYNMAVVPKMSEPEIEQLSPPEHEKSWNDLIDEEEEIAHNSVHDDEEEEAEEEDMEVQLANKVATGLSLNVKSKSSLILEEVARDSGVGSPDQARELVGTPNRQSEVDKNRMASPSTASESTGDGSRKNRSDSGCSYGTSDETVTVTSKTSVINGGTDDSGNASTEADDHLVYSYHFMVPGHLCGKFIGVKGATVRQLRSATTCEVYLVLEDGTKQIRKPQYNSPQICVVEGTRSAIDRCLVLVREKFPLSTYPELTLEQVNKPTVSSMEAAAPADNVVACQLVLGQPMDVYVSAIVSGGHIFVQLPYHPTFSALTRLEYCMLNVYERLPNLPQVPRELVTYGLVCAAKFDGKWYRLQVVSYDVNTDSCEVKFLDYGGYTTVSVGDLWKIRSDFLTLPFQAVECYMANVIPPNGSEWPFESGAQLEDLIKDQNVMCRMIASADDYVPMVELYTKDPTLPAATSIASEAEGTRFVNKELVERGAAVWIEHFTEAAEVA